MAPKDIAPTGRFDCLVVPKLDLGVIWDGIGLSTEACNCAFLETDGLSTGDLVAGVESYREAVGDVSDQVGTAEHTGESIHRLRLSATDCG